MFNLKLFDTLNNYNNYISSETAIFPNISYIPSETNLFYNLKKLGIYSEIIRTTVNNEEYFTLKVENNTNNNISSAYFYLYKYNVDTPIYGASSEPDDSADQQMITFDINAHETYYYNISPCYTDGKSYKFKINLRIDSSSYQEFLEIITFAGKGHSSGSD